MMPSPALASLTGLRILVVEDEYMIAVHIETLLEDCGCAVVGPVATIDEAIALARNERLDGALLDTNLQGKSSAPIAVVLRALSIPFVVVTGYGLLPIECTELNDAPRLAKPFSADGFVEKLAATFLK